jgi:hypothetical protein
MKDGAPETYAWDLRDPRADPRRGDVLHHPEFALGARFIVVRASKTGGRHGVGYVSCRIVADDGHPIRAGITGVRTYAMSGWWQFMAGAAIVERGAS